MMYVNIHWSNGFVTNLKGDDAEDFRKRYDGGNYKDNMLNTQKYENGKLIYTTYNLNNVDYIVCGFLD